MGQSPDAELRTAFVNRVIKLLERRKLPFRFTVFVAMCVVHLAKEEQLALQRKLSSLVQRERDVRPELVSLSLSLLHLLFVRVRMNGLCAAGDDVAK